MGDDREVEGGGGAEAVDEEEGFGGVGGGAGGGVGVVEGFAVGGDEEGHFECVMWCCLGV